MSMQAKWSDGVQEFWAAGLSGMNCCPLEMAEPPPFTALGLSHQYSFRCHREAAAGFWQEALPHTHFRLLLFASSPVSKSSVKKALLFGPGTEAADTQLVI